jgi:Tfp pilus assembly protein PilN
MLRINLLPSYIYEKKTKVAHIVAALLLMLVVLGGSLAWALAASGTKAAAQKRLDTANSFQSQYTDIDTQITDVKTQVAAIQAKQDFISGSQTYNTAWPVAIDAVAQDVPPYILLNSLNISAADHHVVTLTGFGQHEMDLARWWIALRNDTFKFSNVFITLPEHPYPAGGTQAGGAGGFGFGAGMMGGKRGGMMGGPPGMMGGAPGMMGPGGPGMGMMGPGGPGMGRGGFGNARNTGTATASEVQGRKGYDFTATLMLVDKLAPPTTAPAWTGVPAPNTAGSSATGMGGMGMGMMGGPPGMMGGPPMMGGPAGAPGAMPPAGGSGAGD